LISIRQFTAEPPFIPDEFAPAFGVEIEVDPELLIDGCVVELSSIDTLLLG
jgi:hypothetical protein